MKSKTKKVVNHISDVSDDSDNDSEIAIQITTKIINEETQDSESDESEKEVTKLLRKFYQNLKKL